MEYPRFTIAEEKTNHYHHPTINQLNQSTNQDVNLIIRSETTNNTVHKKANINNHQYIILTKLCVDKLYFP